MSNLVSAISKESGNTMRLKSARDGIRLEVRQRVAAFSLWPTYPGLRNRHKLQTTLLSLDPWVIIERVIEERCPVQSQEEARACIAQAKDFFHCANQAGALEAKPLSLYYSQMNIVKAFCLTRGLQTTFDKAQHGLSERIRPPHQELRDAFLRAFPSPNKKKELQNFDELYKALTGSGLGTDQDFNITELMPQVVSAHRLWCSATDSGERFVPIHEAQYWVEAKTKTIWLRLLFKHDDLTRHGISVTRLLKQSGLHGSYKLVSIDKITDEYIATLEQSIPLVYKGFASDKLRDISSQIRNFIWTIASTTSPYRKHYVYLSPAAEVTSRLPQVLAMYALSYYLGSITRYRPHHYPKIIRTEYGPFIQDFITGQPQQFLYLMASEFAEQDVAKPAILI
jgi:hypothetical protein